MIKVKICGITREEDLEAAVEAGADSLGFVVGVPISPRNLSFSEARYLIAKVPQEVSSVAVTVFKTMDELVRIYSGLEADLLQIHGNLHRILESIVEIPSKSLVIGAVDCRAPEAFDWAVKFSETCRSVLLDTASEGGLGGTGVIHDWNLSRSIRDEIHPTPLILAGGLTPENVGEAIRRVKPYGVDVSSGVEKEPGVKDPEKMFDFVVKAKEAKL